jgi:signal transduction histidine kinase
MTQSISSDIYSQIVHESRVRLRRFTAIVLLAVCFFYAIFWHLLGIAFLSVLCASIAMLTFVLLFNEQCRIPNTLATHGLVVAAVACLYFTTAHIWSYSVVTIGYLPVVIVGTFLLLDRRMAIAWTVFNLILVLSMPSVSKLFAVKALPAQFIDAFNMTNAVTILLVTAAIVHIFENLSRSVIEALLGIKVQLEKTQKDLIDVQHYRNRFFASISHEIRTPMNAVRGISELLLQDKKIPSHAQPLVNALHRSSNHLLGVVNDLLDVSKLEVGTLRWILICMTVFRMRA